MKEIIKVVLTGAECTGKTELAEQLAKYYNTVWVPEYAREFVEKANYKYNYNDVVHIAEKQIELLNTFSKEADHFLFIDTYLIIIKIWLQWSFKKYPEWIDEYIQKDDIDLYLLCSNDIPWYLDKARENSGENRDKLYNEYLNELQKYKKNYVIIKGVGKERLENTIDAVDKYRYDKNIL